MTNDVYKPRPDTVDGELFLETRATAAATAALWQVLALARQEPRPWIPTVVLAGESGSGRTTVAKRFVKASQRNASCDILRERVPDPDPERAKRDAEALTRGLRWAERMTLQFGTCPGICHPSAWVPRHPIEQAIFEAQTVHPAVRLNLAPRPDRDGLQLGDVVWTSPGNCTHHPTRRTSILMVDDADRILSVPATRRRDVLDRIQAWEKLIKHPLAVVLIGSPALAEVVAESRTTHVIRLDPMTNDGEFAWAAAMICGARDPKEVAALHQSTGGLMGRLCHVARVRGLTPPYDVKPDEIVRLPVPDGLG